MKKDIPSHFKYQNDHRTPDILITTTPGYYLTKKMPKLRKEEKKGLMAIHLVIFKCMESYMAKVLT